MYPELTRDRKGLAKLIRDFSWPGGFPSHVAPIVPGTIHEGGELGYALATGFGAALDNPDLIVAAIVGDGEAETGPTAGAWHSNKFLDPATGGAVLPILHLNGYKIANPTIFKAMSDDELTKLFEGYGWHPLIVEGDDLDAEPGRRARHRATARSASCRRRRAAGTRPERPRWPMIVLKSLKGWTGPKEVDGVQVEGTSKAHQVPAMKAKSDAGAPQDPGGLAALLQAGGAVRRERRPDPGRARRVPDRRPAHGREPATSTAARCARTSSCPSSRPSTRLDVSKPGETNGSALMALGEYYADVFRLNEDEANFRIMCPDEVASNRLGAVFEATDHTWEWPLDPEIDTGHAPDGRIMEILSEHNCQGWLQGYVLTGRHGLFPCYEAFIPIIDGMVNQYSKFLKMSKEEAPWREPVAGLNYLLTSVGWRQDHNGYSHQMPGFINSMLNRKEDDGARVPAAGREHPAGDDGAGAQVHDGRSTS